MADIGSSSSSSQPATLQDATSPAAPAAAAQNHNQQAPSMDFASILSKIQMLEKEKADMRAQLEMANVRLSKLQVRTLQ